MLKLSLVPLLLSKSFTFFGIRDWHQRVRAIVLGDGYNVSPLWLLVERDVVLV